MRYQINYDELMKNFGRASTEEELSNTAKESIRAIFYLLKAGSFAIDEELYLDMDDSGKKYFIGIAE